MKVHPPLCAAPFGLIGVNSRRSFILVVYFVSSVIVEVIWLVQCIFFFILIFFVSVACSCEHIFN